MHHLLLVDNDIELCQLLKEYLTQEGFTLDMVHDGGQVAETLATTNFDLMILDVMLPNKNGFDVLREVSRTRNMPILMLTAKGDDIDRILGLEMGADDYLAKPCNPRELVARIRSIIRRFNSVPTDNTQVPDEVIEALDVLLDIKRREVKVAGNLIDLTATEFDILVLLLRHAGDLITREQISEQCLGRKLLAFDRSIDMHISHLRKKLSSTDCPIERIKTIRGTGYQYVAV